MTFRHRFHRALSFSSPAFALLSIAGCAASPPPAAASPSGATSAAPPPAPPVDVTAVPAPENLIVFARMKNLAASSKVATDWAHLPTLDPVTFVEGLINGATETKDNAVLATIVDPELPIDFAASFEAQIPPKAFGAFAAAVKSIDAAKSALAGTYDITAADGGVFLLALRADHHTGKKRLDNGDGLPTCELAPAAGAAPYRVVCGTNHDALTALAPYLTRTAPRDVGASDVHVEFRAKPVGGYATIGRLEGPKIIGSLLGMNAASEPATFDLVSAVIGDFLDYVSDLDVMTFDATLDPAHAGLAMRTTFKSKTSLMAQLSTAHPERVDVPPSAVWRLPADVDVVSFGSGIDDADIQHARDLAVAALAEQLGKTKLADADRRALTDVAKESFRAPSAVVAHGMDGAASYWLLERDEAPAVTEKLARDWVATWNRPGIAKAVKAKLPPSALPPVVKLAAPIAGLPKGSLHFEVTIFPDVPSHAPVKSNPPHGATTGGAAVVAQASGPELYHLVVVPDGPRSWVGLSNSESALRSKLAYLAATVPGADSLGARAGLQGLAGFKESRMSAGGFFTVRSLLELARLSLTGKSVSKASRWDALAGRLPAKGTTPIVFTASPGAPTAEDPGGVRDAEMNVPADAIRDAVWFGLQASDLLGK